MDPDDGYKPIALIANARTTRISRIANIEPVDLVIFIKGINDHVPRVVEVYACVW